jgi:hypothetical protein
MSAQMDAVASPLTKVTPSASRLGAISAALRSPVAQNLAQPKIAKAIFAYIGKLWNVLQA